MKQMYAFDFNTDFRTIYNELWKICHLFRSENKDCEATINTHGEDYFAMSAYYKSNEDIYDEGLYNNLVNIAQAMEVDALMKKRYIYNRKR